MRPGDTPVPIPNTMVKTRTADGTALETVWESRWPPDLRKRSKGILVVTELRRYFWDLLHLTVSLPFVYAIVARV